MRTNLVVQVSLAPQSPPTVFVDTVIYFAVNYLRIIKASLIYILVTHLGKSATIRESNHGSGVCKHRSLKFDP